MLVFTQLSQHCLLNSAKVSGDTWGILEGGGAEPGWERRAGRALGQAGLAGQGPHGLLTHSLHVHWGPAVGPALSQALGRQQPKSKQKKHVVSSRIAQGDQLCALCPPRGWDREGGREGDARGRRYGDICIRIADSLCYTAATNTTL